MEPKHITDRHMYSGGCTLKRAISRMITGLIVAMWTDRSDFEFELRSCYFVHVLTAIFVIRPDDLNDLPLGSLTFFIVNSSQRSDAMITEEETIATQTPKSLAEIREFMRLPIEERRRILEKQAEQMVEYYEEESARREREEWQGGDILEY